MSELLAVTSPYIYFNAQLFTALRPVYTCDFLCNFCRTSHWNFFRALTRPAISVRFVAAVSNMFEAYATWRKLQEILHSNHREIAIKSPLVYTCDKSCIGERDKNRISEWAFILVYQIIS